MTVNLDQHICDPQNTNGTEPSVRTTLHKEWLHCIGSLKFYLHVITNKMVSSVQTTLHQGFSSLELKKFYTTEVGTYRRGAMKMQTHWLGWRCKVYWMFTMSDAMAGECELIFHNRVAFSPIKANIWYSNVYTVDASVSRLLTVEWGLDEWKQIRVIPNGLQVATSEIIARRMDQQDV